MPTLMATRAAAAAATGGPAAAAPSVQVPGYEILGELGRGGMGVVYKAYQKRLKRLVALKMILAGPHAGPDALLRFRREAEASARLQHPNVVQIYEVGEHDGRPYLALEFVEGGSLARELRARPPAARDAARLVELVAGALHYAHGRGVVHRDLKPANILLTADGQPKVGDFGLAKRLDDDDGGATRTGAVLGTPGYLAPEQAGGQKDVGPAADVWALGATLYELLTGRPPFLADTAQATVLQALRADPVPPTRLRPGLPRDLQTICLKCLEKDPRRRYADAAALADDLRRFREGEPVRARPASLWDKSVKWARRRPTAAALSAVCAAALAVLVGGAVWYESRLRASRDRAEANTDLALQAVDDMLITVGEKDLAREPRMEAKRKELLLKALAFAKRFVAVNGDKPEYRLRSAQIYKLIGDIERQLGEYEEARQAYAQAIAGLDRLRAEDAGDAKYRETLAECWNFLGESCRLSGRAEEAEAAYVRAADLQGALRDEFPGRPEYAVGLGRTRYNLGILYKDDGRPGDAERELNRAVELLNGSGDDPARRQHLARALLDLGAVLRAARRPDEAGKANGRAAALLCALLREDEDNPEYQRELGVVYNDRGHLAAGRGWFAAAAGDHEKARALFARLKDLFPKAPEYRQELALALNSLGAALLETEGPEPAGRAWDEAARLQRALIDGHRDVPAYRGDLGLTLGNVGLGRIREGKLKDARVLFEQAIEELRAAVAALPKNPDYRDGLYRQYRNLAECRLQLGEYAEAAKAAESLADGTDNPRDDAYFAAGFLARCARAARGDPGLTADEQNDRARLYGDRSVIHLREAVNAGFRFGRELSDEQEKMFEAVKDRADFNDLVRRTSEPRP
jgi:serine/threonine-protein kinase